MSLQWKFNETPWKSGKKRYQTEERFQRALEMFERRYRQLLRTPSQEFKSRGKYIPAGPNKRLGKNNIKGA
jgi:hypothetical protein